MTMRDHRNTNKDSFVIENYLAITVLETLGNVLPSEDEIEAIEAILKRPYQQVMNLH